MDRIRVEQPFILYAFCKIEYDGRAKSSSEFGNHLIIHKTDGTLLIHRNRLCTPLNYQPPKAILKKDKNYLISCRKDETIKIVVDKIVNYTELANWSSKEIKISRTEKELRDYIVDHLEDLLDLQFAEKFIEFETPVGYIDILGIDEHGIYHVIEVKRGKASLASCSQLNRYSQYFLEIGKSVRDYLASPSISKNALRHAKEMKQTWIKVNHNSQSSYIT